jgi:hypothetical protein
MQGRALGSDLHMHYQIPSRATLSQSKPRPGKKNGRDVLARFETTGYIYVIPGGLPSASGARLLITGSIEGYIDM